MCAGACASGGVRLERPQRGVSARIMSKVMKFDMRRDFFRHKTTIRFIKGEVKKLLQCSYKLGKCAFRLFP